MSMRIEQDYSAFTGRDPPPSNGTKKAALFHEEQFERAQAKLAKFGFRACLAGAAGLLLGAIKYGGSFPAKALGALGDFGGALTALAAPFFHWKNEVNNRDHLKNRSEKKERSFFDDFKDLFYRFGSIGFTPYVFKPFIDPTFWGKSIWHKITNIVNLPILGFIGWGYGVTSFSAVLSWWYRKSEQTRIASLEKKIEATTNEAEKARLRVHLESCEARFKGYDQKFDGQRRLLTIASITIPAMQGLRQWADSMAFFTGKMSFKEFFSRPIQGLCRLVSFFVGPLATFSKGFDCAVRIADEYEHLQPTLPKSLRSYIKTFSEWFKGKMREEDNFLKRIRQFAEIVFHTLSPMSMFSLIAPLVDEPFTDKQAQARGGFAKAYDTTIGVLGKIAAVTCCGSYVVLARLPQTIFQSIYFGRWFYGQWIKKERKEDTAAAIERIQNNICNSPIVKGVSKKARQWVEYLLPGFYEGQVNCSYKTYEEVMAIESFAQVKEKYKDVLKSTLTDDARAEIIGYCLEVASDRAKEGYHELDDKEVQDIKNNVKWLLDKELGLIKNMNIELPFPGSSFIAEEFVRLLDFEARFRSMSSKSPHHRMTTAYHNDEVGISYNGELKVVESECIMGGLRRFGNLVIGFCKWLGRGEPGVLT